MKSHCTTFKHLQLLHDTMSKSINTDVKIYHDYLATTYVQNSKRAKARELKKQAHQEARRCMHA